MSESCERATEDTGLLVDGYRFQTKPFQHQLEIWRKTRDLSSHALHLEQGTGKTKLVIDEATWLHGRGEINGFFVLAPNGVHRNWVVEEIPVHMPEATLARCRAHWYDGGRAATKRHEQRLEWLTSTPPGDLAVLAMSYDSMMTEHGRRAAWEFLRRRRCMYALDEARRIKSPAAKRTKRVVASGVHAPYRRTLDGTPVTNGPFDIYCPIQFLDPDFWKRKGISSFSGFKVMFADWKQVTIAGGRKIDLVDGYKNLNLLQGWLEEIGTRVTKDEVLDLPPKMFTRRSFDLTPEQERVYRDLRDSFLTFLESGELVTATLALTRLLRLQQVTCGYVPADADQSLQDIGKSNPRLDLLGELCADTPHKTIIWSRFSRDIDKICALLGGQAVRYDGKVDQAGRAVALDRFQKPGGDAKFFVANPQAAGEGLTLHAARTVIYYANSFNLADRLQSEDRAHRIGQQHPVEYIDLVASGTVDEHVVRTLVKKLDIAAQITGDSIRQWLA